MVASAKVLLISLINSTDAVGLKYIHSALLAHDHQSFILFYSSDDEAYAPIITAFIEQEQFDFVGVSVLSRYFAKAARLSTEIKKGLIGKTMIAWGGVHPTIDPESCKPYCDYVCVGEAEKAFPLFIKDHTVSVHGFTQSNKNGYTACEFIKNLDECHFPDHFPSNAYITDALSVKPLDKKLFQKHSRYRGTYLSVITSRGCPFNCSYCCNDLLAKVVGRKIRERSPENVIKEIEEQIEKTFIKFNYIDMYDDCFTSHSEQWLEEFVNLYKKIRIPLVVRTIPQFMTENKIRILKNGGLGLTSIGIQSGSERTNREIYLRNYSRENLLNVARFLDRNHIPALYDIIIDNPFENEEDLRQTLDVVGQLPPTSDILFYSLTFFPNTKLYIMAKQAGLDVNSHLIKSTHLYDNFSNEVILLRLAQFFGSEMAIKAMEANKTSGRYLVVGAYWVIILILWPLRTARMAFLSQNRNLKRFCRLFMDFVYDYVKKIWLPGKSK